MSRVSPDQQQRIDRGWSPADVAEHEYVDDAWIAANTTPGKAPSKVRHLGGRLLAAVRTIGVDPLEGAEQADLAGLLPKLPRAVRRSLIQSGGLTRDQMRRIAARTGYPYVEAWSGWNRGGMAGVWGALIHHTGTPWSVAGDYPTLRTVQQGRADLQNSLCAFGLGRSGTIYLVSEKLSWHGGAGNWNGCTDANGKMVGIEAESDGVNWTPEERDAYPRLVASILIEIGQDDRYTTRHGSYALPAGRKDDAKGLDMGLFWRQVYGYLANPASVHKDYGRAPLIIGAIGDCYRRPGVAAALGAPLDNEAPTANPDGRTQRFERGRILWHPAADANRAHALVGAIADRFVAAGGESSCGWPVTDEGVCADGIGRYGHFTGGQSIYWHPTTGARRIYGGIREAWIKTGAEWGTLGYPVDEEHAADGGIVQTFQRGSILWAGGRATVRPAS